MFIVISHAVSLGINQSNNLSQFISIYQSQSFHIYLAN